MPRITLIGYRGSGKSTIAAGLSDLLGCSWQDADDALEAETGTTIAEFISARGEPAFRDLETVLLERLLATESGVVATGGGVVLRQQNRHLLRQAGRPVVWLTAPADVLRHRLAADPSTAARRPALAGGDVLDEVAAAVTAREPLYRSAADAAIDVSATPPTEVVARIAAWLEKWVPPDETPRAEAIP